MHICEVGLYLSIYDPLLGAKLASVIFSSFPALPPCSICLAAQVFLNTGCVFKVEGIHHAASLHSLIAQSHSYSQSVHSSFSNMEKL